MILGIGTDITDGRRIEAILDRHKDKFAKRILQSELMAANKTATRHISLPNASRLKRLFTRRSAHRGLPVVAGGRLKHLMLNGAPYVNLTGVVKLRLRQ